MLTVVPLKLDPTAASESMASDQLLLLLLCLCRRDSSWLPGPAAGALLLQGQLWLPCGSCIRGCRAAASPTASRRFRHRT